MNTPLTPPGKPPVRLGDLLLEQGLITQDQLRIALLEQKSMGKPLGETLLALGFVTEDPMVKIAHRGAPLIALSCQQLRQAWWEPLDWT